MNGSLTQQTLGGLVAGGAPEDPRAVASTLLRMLHLVEREMRALETVQQQFADLGRWFAEGKLRPHVSHRLDLSRAGEALDLLLTRMATGKVVLTTGRS